MPIGCAAMGPIAFIHSQESAEVQQKPLAFAGKSARGSAKAVGLRLSRKGFQFQEMAKAAGL
jgi:hypothetical protein